MTIQLINVGTSPNDGLGDPIRTAFIKCNNDFIELYSRAQPYPPVTLVGNPGDQSGMYSYDPTYFYYCFADYDGSSIIWAQIAQMSDISLTHITNGNTRVDIPQRNGNVVFTVGGYPNVLVVTNNGIVVNQNIQALGSMSANGNIISLGTVYGNSASLGNIIIYNDTITSNTSRVNINASNSLKDFAVNGGNANILYVDGGSNTVSVGTSQQTYGATFAVNAVDSMLLPVGNTLQRPSYPATGMLRFNTNTNTAEVFNGAFWISIGVSNYTIITDDQYTGDGHSVSFFLNTPQTTNSCVVSINGIVQMPMIAYTVSNSIITFSDPPEPGDIIDVRGVVTPEITDEQFTGDGVTTTFTLMNDQVTNGCMVTINGVIQLPVRAYNVVDNKLIFTQAPQPGDEIDLRAYPGSSITTNTYTGSGTQTLFILPESQSTISSIVSINGVLQVPGISYSIAGTSLIFSQPPEAGDLVEVRQFTVVSKDGLYNSSGNASVVVSETSADVVVTGNLRVANGSLYVGNIFNTNGNGIGNIGSGTSYYNRVFAVSTSAIYSDLAENYLADASYSPGTVLSFGGAHEVTISAVDLDVTVAGVVSTAPSYLMNSGLEGQHVVTLALTGRVPCLVEGPISKGDMMVSAGNGRARAESDPKLGSVIGKALENFDGVQGTIEVVVGRL